MNRERILVIEENLEIAHQIVALCFKMGWEPLLARDGFTGMLLALRAQPRLIVCDVETAGLDGFEIVRRARLHPELNGTAIVAISKVTPRKPAANQSGFDAHVLKPVCSTQLAEIVLNLIQQHHETFAQAV